MSDLFTGFDWDVWVTGYKPITGIADTQIAAASNDHPSILKKYATKTPQQFLVFNDPDSRSQNDPLVRKYQPLEKTGLFQIFAGVQPTTAGIVDFANSYGSLGTGCGFVEGTRRRYGEPLKLWRDQLKFLRIVNTIWQFAKSDNTEALSDILELAQGGSVLFKQPPPDPIYGIFRDLKIISYWTFKTGDLIVAAFQVVEAILNSQLTQFSLSAKVKGQPDKPVMDFQIVPKNLLAAIWLQFAQAVSGNKDYRRCDQCGTPFEVSLAPEGKRKNRKFCTDACRFKAYRERQSRARELHAKGLSVNKIAKRLESTTATIKNWIK